MTNQHSQHPSQASARDRPADDNSQGQAMAAAAAATPQLQTAAAAASPQTGAAAQMITTKTGKVLDPQQMHVCRLCDKLLSSSSSLDRHMLTHSGERPFVCKRCHMTFTTNGNMHRHMRTHLHKDSLARQQQEQLQLKQSLLAGNGAGPLASGALSSASQLQQQVANSLAGHQFHHHQRGIFSPVAGATVALSSSPPPPPPPPPPSVRAGQQHQLHFQAAPQQVAAQAALQSNLMSAPHMSPHVQGQQTPLVGPALASLLAAAAANNTPSGHMQALLNQHLVAAMLQQRQQPPDARAATNKHQLELSNLGMQTSDGASGQRAYGGAREHPGAQPADISAQLFQNHQQALAAVASQLMQHQQRAQPAGASLEQLDAKSLMVSAALAAAGQAGDPQANLESVRAVMLAAATAAAASKAMQRETPPGQASNNLLMEMPLDRQQQQRPDSPHEQQQQRLVRGKRRKQVNPLRSHCQQKEEEEEAQQHQRQRDELREADDERGEEEPGRSGASSLIEDLLAGCEREAARDDERAPPRVAVKYERGSQSPQQREDFNNNNELQQQRQRLSPARAAGQLVKALLLNEAADVQQRRSSGSPLDGAGREAKPLDFGDSEADEESSDGGSASSLSAGTARIGRRHAANSSVDVLASKDVTLGQESGTDMEDDSGDDDLDVDFSRAGARALGDQNNNSKSNNNNNNIHNSEARNQRDEEDNREAAISDQIISLNYTNTSSDSLNHRQDCSDATNTSTSDDRRPSSSFVSSSRETTGGDEEEDDYEDDGDRRHGSMFDGANGTNKLSRHPSDARQNQTDGQRYGDGENENNGELEDEDEANLEGQRDLQSGITRLGPGDEDDEIIEDISQSYVKTANPNATRKGGKRNRHCYKCKLCTYSSVDRCTLVRHLRIHSGERPYICGICRYAFTTKANCERHVRKRHKKQYNSLGGSGGVKGSNGGGRSLIITDHSNHQTIPVKVNPVAAQTISQTLRRIQEKEQQQQQHQQHQQQQQQPGSPRESDAPSGGCLSAAATTTTTTTTTTAMLEDHNNIERIYEGYQGASNNNNYNAMNNHVHSAKSGSSNGKRKHRHTDVQDLDDMPANQRRRLAGKQQPINEPQSSLGILSLTPHKDMFGGSLGSGFDTDLQPGTINFGVPAPVPSSGLICEPASSSGDLFSNLLAQIQQMTNNNNNIKDNNNHLDAASNPKQLSTPISSAPGSGSHVSNATLLANMLAAGKAMAASETPQQTPAVADQLNSLLSTKHLSHQFAQLRNLNLRNPLFNRRNPFYPFNSLDLAAQALDLSCGNQPAHK